MLVTLLPCDLREVLRAWVCVLNPYLSGYRLEMNTVLDSSAVSS